ncbi:helix-turn-helix domain-containing protein [Kitasatospora sp. NPDC058965]|uniref:helix-turn-helix domain-containing protein n=1 Tax=Kitasatospora sp. NPDC058965 TaxID=3346682 RepID=UPI00367610CC
MGRENSALAEQNTRVLAQWLRSLRERSGLTYSQLAHKTSQAGMPVSTSTLWRADGGRSTPTWAVAEAYTRACGGSVREAERLWIRARSSPQGRKAVATAMSARPVKALRYITERAELLHAMSRLRLRAGNPSLRELEQRAFRNGVSHLPHSTLHGVLCGRRDCSRPVLVEFVRACGVGPARERDWIAAWERVDTYDRGGSTVLSDVRRRLAAAEEEVRRLKQAMGSQDPADAPRSATADAPAAEPVPLPPTCEQPLVPARGTRSARPGWWQIRPRAHRRRPGRAGPERTGRDSGGRAFAEKLLSEPPPPRPAAGRFDSPQAVP